MLSEAGRRRSARQIFDVRPHNHRKRMRVFSFVLIWLALAALAAYYLFGSEFNDSSLLQWALIVTLGPPAVVILQGLGDWLGELFNKLPGVRAGNAYVERRTARESLSGLRVLWYLLTSLLAIAIVVGATWLVRHGSA